jgi:hypothetical protein
LFYDNDVKFVKKRKIIWCKEKYISVNVYIISISFLFSYKELYLTKKLFILFDYFITNFLEHIHLWIYLLFILFDYFIFVLKKETCAYNDCNMCNMWYVIVWVIINSTYTNNDDHIKTRRQMLAYAPMHMIKCI